MHTKSLIHSSSLFDAPGTKLALPNCVIQCYIVIIECGIACFPYAMHVLKVAELAHGEKLHTKSLTHSSNLFDALGTKLALPNCVIQCSLSSVQHVQSNFALYASGLLLHYLLPSCLMLFPCIVQVNAGND